MNAGQIKRLLSRVPDKLPVCIQVNEPIEISQWTVQRLRDRCRYVDYVETERDYAVADYRLLEDCLVLYTRPRTAGSGEES